MEVLLHNKGQKRMAAIFVVFSVFLFAFFYFIFDFEKSSAASAPALITYQGKLLVSGSAATGTVQMTFVLYDSLTAGTALYTASGTTGVPATTDVTMNSGLFTVELGGTGTNVLDTEIFKNNGTIYLEVKIGSETLSPRKRITSVPYALNAKYLDGYFATSTPTTTAYIPVSDASGTFSFNAVKLNGTTRTDWPLGRFSATTSASYQGDMGGSQGGFTGYKAANYLCAVKLSGSHLCSSEEIIMTIRDGDTSNFVGTAWVANGPPGYTAYANDCMGFTSKGGTILGAFWEFDSTTGGKGWLVNCETSRPLACCK